MSDQEQTERGASTVRGRVHLNTGEIRRTAHAGYFNVQEIVPLCDEIDQLRADLERVTAERENGTLALHVTTCWNNSLEARLMQAEAERDAMREVVEAGVVWVDIDAETKESQQVEDVLIDALLAYRRLDATRKATAEHPLPERGPGYDPLCQCGQPLHRRRLHDEATADAMDQ